ncbi:SURF1 family cytochrome oxidase biogenesis protein [Allosphingosinicella sp.]|uniref:SURF1 family cytochrome oxidase biogenesis protein n=1 Tax=Allosphingosinicella sp. TaxID=2823234 RepID=UPI002FC2613B
MRLPILPTLVVAAAVAVMIGLGFWQLERKEWKEALIAEAHGSLRPKAYDCAIDAAPEVRAGRSRAGESGYRYIVPCNRSLRIDVGWSKRPNALRRVVLSGRVEAIAEIGNDRLLVAMEPVSSLAPSGLPSAEGIPNNHLFYAFQWFFFAAAATVIYALALMRRGGAKVAPPDHSS